MKGDLGLTQENMNSRGPPSPLLSCVRIIHDPWLVTWIWLVSEMYITHIDRPGPQPIVPCLHHWPWIKFFFLEFKVNIAWVVMTSTTYHSLKPTSHIPESFNKSPLLQLWLIWETDLGGPQPWFPSQWQNMHGGWFFCFCFSQLKEGTQSRLGVVGSSQLNLTLTLTLTTPKPPLKTIQWWVELEESNL